MSAKRYIVGYFCHKGQGHFEMYGDPDADFACGQAAPVYIDREDAVWYEAHGLLPEGRWEE
jgi:hypothetical protein